mmetsp:Transcript_41029/g.162277  ORF Transcript_41029/g.162277 Transcript_41029/m.162277 type:complete len:741 (-) Transcript_41029:66-2288(-)
MVERKSKQATLTDFFGPAKSKRVKTEGAASVGRSEDTSEPRESRPNPVHGKSSSGGSKKPQPAPQSLESGPKESPPAEVSTPEVPVQGRLGEGLAKDEKKRPWSQLDKIPEQKTGEEYDPLKGAWWDADKETPYLHLARTFERVARTSSRIRTVELLSDMMRSILCRREEDLLPALYLCSGQLAPAWEGIELGLGSRALSQALRDATGASRSGMRSSYVRLGDIGDVAMEMRVSVRTIVQPKPLTVGSVYTILRQVATDKGTGSVQRKAALAKSLFIATRECEIRWITRMLVQNMRIGAVTKTILVALARTIVLERDPDADLEEATKAVVEAYSRCSSFDILCEILLKDGSWRNCLTDVPVRPGIPMKPQLGKITRDAGALLKRFEGAEVSCEMKYDGQRAQLHVLENGSVRVFSRHLEEVTRRYDGVVPAVQCSLALSKVKTAILDAEIVAVDRASENRLLPFQTLAARSSDKLDVCVMVFDLLYLNGKQLLHQSLTERRSLLLENFQFTPGEFCMVEEKTLREEEDIMDWLQEAVKAGGEGLMCKALTGPLSTYEPALRSEGWAKMKKDYVEGLTGSLDLVPIAAWWGNGRKAGWLSPFLLACYNDGEFQSLCKVMSGYSDKQYEALTAFYKDGRMLREKPPHYIVSRSLQPSVWLDACKVWEIKGADFTVSPVHLAAAGLVHEEKGISLRFPRFIEIRTDKGTEDATTAEEIAEMYHSQASMNPSRGIPGEAGDVDE